MSDKVSATGDRPVTSMAVGIGWQASTEGDRSTVQGGITLQASGMANQEHRVWQRITKPHKEAQNRLLWRDKTCLACTYLEKRYCY